jgi:hypothetical protein
MESGGGGGGRRRAGERKAVRKMLACGGPKDPCHVEASSGLDAR